MVMNLGREDDFVGAVALDERGDLIPDHPRIAHCRAGKGLIDGSYQTRRRHCTDVGHRTCR